jgi:hypothetical protein
VQAFEKDRKVDVEGKKGVWVRGEVSGDDRKVFKAIKQMKKRKKLFG